MRNHLNSPSLLRHDCRLEFGRRLRYPIGTGAERAVNVEFILKTKFHVKVCSLASSSLLTDGKQGLA